MAPSVEQSSSRGHGPLLSLIRHPETIANVANIYQGSTDSPLSVHGSNQLRALAKSVATSSTIAAATTTTIRKTTIAETRIKNQARSPLLVDRPPTLILTSPLGRTRALAEALQDAQQQQGNRLVECIVRPGLAERCFGAQEGSSTANRSRVTGFPRGKGPKESDVAWSHRVRTEAEHLKSLLATPWDEQVKEKQAQKHIVVVSHGMWINKFLRLVLPPDAQTQLPFTSNTGIFTLSCDGQVWRLLVSNDTSHLIGLKRQRGGIGSSASDKKQRTLDTMLRPKSTSRADAQGSEEQEQALSGLPHDDLKRA